MEVKNVPEAAERIKKAIDKKERIILYGDADLDGVCSVLILKEALKNMGGEIAAVYFPNREEEGYGITKTALEALGKFAPALFIAMDLGISNFEEIDLANQKGFEVILIDHHQILGSLPSAFLIVDPKQEGEQYPFTSFAACGLTLRVAEHVLGKAMTNSLRKSLVELATLGTIADMMPREQDNQALIEEGLSYLPQSWRPGLQALFQFEPFSQALSLEEKIARVISLLNVRDIQYGLPAAFRLLVVSSLQDAEALLERLWEISKVRHGNIRAFVEEVERNIAARRDDLIIFEGTTELEYVLLGGAASVLANRYKKPVFLYRERGAESLGSVRAPLGYDTVKAMTYCSQFLSTYGGHAQASGFRLKTEHIDQFRSCLIKFFSTHEKS